MTQSIATRYRYSGNGVHLQRSFSALDKSRSTFLTGLTICILLLIVSAIFYIGIRVKVVNLGYQINEEILTKAKLIEANKRLSFQIAQLKSPTRIEKEAREKLGLILPKAGQVLYLSQLDINSVPSQLAKADTGPKTQAKTPAKKQSVAQNTKRNRLVKAPLKNKSSVVIAKLTQKNDSGQKDPRASNRNQQQRSIPAVMVDSIP